MPSWARKAATTSAFSVMLASWTSESGTAGPARRQATSLHCAAHFRRNADAGMLTVNVPTAGVDFHVLCGGSKGLSYGAREEGGDAPEFFAQVKTAYTAAG